ncbi:MAG: C4-type zinc ribbon domain-containing protein [Flavobacteriales bacterium]|tara:strand:- start:1302 stop:2117 length:816 start_codon:yes stop_codon:yes gene_type:complete
MAKKEATIEERLKALYDLQIIDSTIDKILTVRGELPLEVQDLEDEVEGLTLRLDKLTSEIEDLTTDISNKKNGIKDSGNIIKRYEEQQNKVRNNREFDAITKEMEFQTLEIELSEKRIKEGEFKLTSKQERVLAAKEYLDGRKIDLANKQNELEEITGETEAEEDKLEKKSAKASKVIDDRLLKAYTRIRGNARNGLAVVTIQRDSCGGCFNKVPPQRQMDIKNHKKVLVCEHCGRILVDAAFDPNYVEPTEEDVKPKRRVTKKKKAEAAE